MSLAPSASAPGSHDSAAAKVSAASPAPAPTPARVETLSLLLPNLDPFASMALRSPLALINDRAVSLRALRALSLRKDLHAAQLEALSSEDPLLFVHAFHMNLPCFHESVQLTHKSAREHLATFSLDPKTGAPLPIDEEEVRFMELRAKGGPQRIHHDEALRVKLLNLQESYQNEGNRKPRDIASEMRLWQETLAPLYTNEAQAFAKARDAMGERCRGDLFRKGFTDAYRNARSALAGKGVLSALIFNESAGWTSGRNLAELSERDYELVAKGVREQHPDVLALLLLRTSLKADMSVANFSDEASIAAIVVGFQLGQLTACDLGVSDCAQGGTFHTDACLMFGGCDQPDLAALWRYVLARDGLDPSAIDRLIENLRERIRRGDMDALGIRRKQ